MRAPTSIRRRLFLQLTGVAALLSVAFFLIVKELAQRAAEETQNDVLLASATSIADSLRAADGNISVDIPYAAFSMLGAISEDRVFYRIEIDGDTLTGYADLPVPAATARQRARSHIAEYKGETVRLVTVYRALNVGNKLRSAAVTIAQTQRGLAGISAQVTTWATAVAVGFFLASMALTFLATQSALQPLSRLATSVSRRGPGDLRPVQSETPQELVPLVDALNDFISRLRITLTRSEDLITEAAHRIRTPLATVRAQAEVTHRRLNKPEHRQAIRDMIRAIDESSRSAGQLLEHAMVTYRSDNLERDEVDLVDLSAEVCKRLMPTAELKDITVVQHFPDTPVVVGGDRVLLQCALHNILDNAIKYSPDESQIELSVFDAPEIGIDVRDQGRGIDNMDAQALMARFSRGANTADVVGSGLGLTIASDVMQSHGGALNISTNKRGPGICASLVF